MCVCDISKRSISGWVIHYMRRERNKETERTNERVFFEARITISQCHDEVKLIFFFRCSHSVLEMLSLVKPAKTLFASLCEKFVAFFLNSFGVAVAVAVFA